MATSTVRTPREQAAEIVAEVYEEQKQHRLPWQESLARIIERRGIATNSPQVPLEETRYEIPGSRFWGAARALVLRPTVARCRREVFGSETVPFETRKAARRWMIAHPRWGSQKEELHRLDRFLAEANKRLKTLRPPKYYRIGLQFEALTLDWRASYAVNSEALATLKRHVEEIVQLTGWTEAETLDLVLLDESPREEVRISGTLHVPPRETAPAWLKERLYYWQTFTIANVRPWHLHRAIFEGLAQQVRRQAVFREQARDDLSLRDRLLLDAVVTVGLPPSSRGQGADVQRTEYWEQLCVAWVKLTGRQVSSDALRKRWTRLPENVRKMLEDVIESRHTESQAHQENAQDTPRRRIRKRSRKLQRRHGRGGNTR